jgi:PAS domain S-box-containing protein
VTQVGDVSGHARLTPPADGLDLLCQLARRVLQVPTAVVWRSPLGADGGDGGTTDDHPLATVAARAVRGGAPVAVDDVGAGRRLPGPVDAPCAVLAVPVPGLGDQPAALCVTDVRPRRWSVDDVEVLELLAVVVASELGTGFLRHEAEASRTRSELAMDAAGIGGFDWDLRTGRLVWDQRLRDLFGYADGGFSERIEDFTARVHPDDAERVKEDIARAIDQRQDFRTQHRVIRRDGGIRWIEARGRVLMDESGVPVRFLGAAYDATAIHEGEARVGRVLDSMSTAFFLLGHDWRFIYVNAEAERILGAPREELLGTEIWQELHANGSPFEEQYRRAMASGQPVDFEAYYPPPLDRWYEVRAWPGPDGLSVYFHDVTSRRSSAAQLERAAARSTLLAQVVAELAGTLEVGEAVERLTRLVVPTLADWCAVALFDDADTGPSRPVLITTGWWHRDPALRPLVERYVSAGIAEPSNRAVIGQAATGAAPVVLDGGAAETIAGLLVPGDARDALLELAPRDCLALPLRAHGRAVGLLTLYGDVLDRRTTAGEQRSEPATDAVRNHVVDLAKEVAARAALGLDNARLYARQRRVAEELQRSLLSPPPVVERLDIEVRYQPAAEAARVGGDWYDVFSPRPEVTTVVIGDVAGHDISAAATMGQIRAMLRGISAGSPKGPAAVLTRLDEVLEILAVEAAATAVVAQLEHGVVGEGPGEQTGEQSEVRLTWSSAGHPTPLVVRPDGVVIELDDGSGKADLLLNVDSAFSRTEHMTMLPVGSTLLLFTDGLVERRGEHYGVGLARLREALAGLTERPLADLCDAVLAQVLPNRPADDVALAAVRIR